MAAPTLSGYWNEAEQDGRFYADPFSRKETSSGPKYDRYPSVTTVLSMTSKDGLKRWHTTMALREAYKNPDAFQTRDASDFERKLLYAADRFRDDRAAIGSNVHEVIEAELKGSWEVPPMFDAEVIQCVDQWHYFLDEHEVRPYVHPDLPGYPWVEVTLINRETGFMGTADGVLYIDGALSLADLKTSRKTHEEHHMQLAALMHCTHALVEVSEGTPGAIRFDKDVTEKGVKRHVKAWFIELPLPKFEALSLIHLRPDEIDPLTGRLTPAFQELVDSPIRLAPLRFEQFKGYALAYSAKKALEVEIKK